MSDDLIYLDSNSYCPILPEVYNFAINNLNTPLNPSSLHSLGQVANSLVEETRDSILNYINSSNHKVLFTSCGSEANNLAILGLKKNFDLYICTAAEHKSIIQPIKQTRNFLILDVDQDGCPNLDTLEAVLKQNLDKKIFLSTIYVNNETGVINNLETIIPKLRLIHNNLTIHSDMGQAFGKLEDLSNLDFKKLDLDLATLIGYKFGSMPGASALIYRSDIEIKPMIFGGSQEYNLRAGTENTVAIHSIKIALDTIYQKTKNSDKTTLRNYLEKNIKKICNLYEKDLIIFSENTQRIWNTSYFAVKDLESKIQLMFFNSHKIYIGTGSACSAGLDEDSHVLESMGFKKNIRKCAVRISINTQSNLREIEIFLEKFEKLIKKFSR
jgi:cysteine desulfurase